MPRKVSSFGPHLMALLLKASRQRVLVELKRKGDAQHLRHRLHQLRSAMRREQHPNVNLVEPVTFRIEEADGQWNLIGEPSDSHFEEAIRQAGIDIDEPETSDAPDQPEPEGSRVESVLKNRYDLGDDED